MNKRTKFITILSFLFKGFKMKKIMTVFLLLFIVTGCNGVNKEQLESPFSYVEGMYCKIPTEELVTEYSELVKDDNVYLFTIFVSVKEGEFIEKFEMNALTQFESLYDVIVLENVNTTMDKYFYDLVDLSDSQHFVKSYVLINPSERVSNEIKTISVNYDGHEEEIDIGVYIELGV